MAVRQAAQDDFGGVARDRLGSAPQAAHRVDCELRASPGRVPAPRTRLDEMRLAYVGLAVRGRRERRHHARHAERARARVALAPAFGDDVDDDCGRGTSPSRRWLPRRPSAPAAHVRDLRVSSGTALRAANGRAELVADRLDQQPSVRDDRGERRVGGVALRRRPRGRTAGRACRSRRARRAQPRVPAERAPRPPALPTAARNARSPVGAEHAVEKARRVRAHQLAAQAVAAWATACAASPRARLASQRAPTSGSDRNAAAMIGLITDAGIAS